MNRSATRTRGKTSRAQADQRVTKKAKLADSSSSEEESGKPNERFQKRFGFCHLNLCLFKLDKKMVQKMEGHQSIGTPRSAGLLVCLRTRYRNW